MHPAPCADCRLPIHPHCRCRQVATKGQARLLTWIVWVLNVLFVLAAVGFNVSLQSYDTLQEVGRISDAQMMGARATGMLDQDAEVGCAHAPLPANSPLPAPCRTLRQVATLHVVQLSVGCVCLAGLALMAAWMAGALRAAQREQRLW